jgi:hypothetical protein
MFASLETPERARAQGRLRLFIMAFRATRHLGLLKQLERRENYKKTSHYMLVFLKTTTLHYDFKKPLL